MTKQPPTREGLTLVRWLLVWSSLSPVFVLWAIRGVAGIDDKLLAPVCVGLAVVPSLILRITWIRMEEKGNEKTVTVVSSEDQRAHMLVYLFAMLIPLYETGLNGWRDLAAAVAAFLLVVFIFGYMRLHYMNLFFAAFGYNIFTVKTATQTRDGRTEQTYAVISKRKSLPADKPLTGIRLGGNVLVDKATE